MSSSILFGGFRTLTNDPLKSLNSRRILEGIPIPSENSSRIFSNRFFIILRPAAKISPGGQALKVSFLEKRNVVRRHLLWKMLFKGITVLEWFILFRELEDLITESSEIPCACLVGLLSWSTGTRERLEDWRATTKPLHRELKNKVPRETSQYPEIENLLELVMSELQIPQKALPSVQLYKSFQIWIPPYGNPPEEKYIGVGYKDKGSLGSESPEGIPEEEVYHPSLSEKLSFLRDDWERILNSFQNKKN